MGEAEATNVTAGIWGFLTLFILAMVCWLLYRSMSKHLRNVRLMQEASDAQKSQSPRDATTKTTSTPSKDEPSTDDGEPIAQRDQSPNG